MVNINYDVSKDSWYSPIEIIDQFEKVRSYYGEERIYDPIFKKAHEMFTGAATLLGAYELSNENLYYMQSNNQTRTPDVMAGKQQTGGTHGIDLLLTQMEMVEMNQHASTDDIVEFLKQTKLSPKKSYTEEDMIVLTINRKVPYDPQKVSKSLLELKPKSTIYIIGRSLDAQVGDFMISTPYPRLYKPIYFNLSTTASKYRLPSRVDFNLSTEKEIKFTKTDDMKPVNTYEVLGLDRDRIYRKFKVAEIIKSAKNLG